MVAGRWWSMVNAGRWWFMVDDGWWMVVNGRWSTLVDGDLRFVKLVSFVGCLFLIFCVFELATVDGDFNIVDYLDRLSVSYVQDENLDSEGLLVALEGHIEHLWEKHEEVKNEVNRLELSSSTSKNHQIATLSNALDEVQEGMSLLQELGSNISSVAVKLGHVGDQLEGTKIQRDRAIDAASLIRHFCAFANFDSRLLPPFEKLEHRGDMDDIDLKQGIDRTRHAAEDCLTDDELEMAVNILVKLKYLSLELPPQSYRTARQRIEFLNQSLETQCISEFRKSLVVDDSDRMRFMSRQLHTLSPKEHSRIFEAMIDFIFKTFTPTMEDAFGMAVEMCKHAADLARRVFESTSVVLQSFTYSVFQKVIETHISRSISEADDKMAHIHSLFLKTQKTAAELSTSLQLSLDVSAQDELCRQVFGIHLQDYLDMEIEDLRSSYTALLTQFYAEINHQRVSKSTGRLAAWGNRALEGALPRSDLIDDVLTTLMIHSNRDALKRCADIAPPRRTSEWCFRVFIELLDGLCIEHLGYALWYGIQTLPPRKQSKTRPHLIFLQAATQVNSIVFLVQKHYQNYVAPLLVSNPDVLQACIARKNGVMTRLEEDISTGISRTVQAQLDWIRHCLQEQEKLEFKPDDTSILELPCTKACEQVTTALIELISQLKTCINGKNLSRVQRHIGCVFHNTLLNHIQNFTFNSTGAVVLSRDLAAYQQAVARLQDPLVDGIFDALKDLAQLLIVKPDTVQQLCTEGKLASMDRGTISRILRLRSDYKAAKLNTIKL
eukprot:gene5891-9077_t